MNGDKGLDSGVHPERPMPTTKIMLIRHAEKPNGDGGPGLMPDGAQNPEALTALGWTRANALVGLFAPANEAWTAAAACEAQRACSPRDRKACGRSRRSRRWP